MSAYDLKVRGLRSLIEFGVKRIWQPGNIRRYAFVAVDVVAKQAVIHIRKYTKHSTI